MGDSSDVGRAYTKWQDICDDPSVSALDKGVAKLQFERYHTVLVDGELYALHKKGINKNGEAVCCGKCANQVDKCLSKMKNIQDDEVCTLFFKFDPTVGKKDIVRDNNVVRLYPLADTWLEWDYGKPVTCYIASDGTRVNFQDSNGKSISWKDLSDGEIQTLSPLLVDSKVIKLSSAYDKFIGHKIKGHIMTLPISSNREIYRTLCTQLPRLDVAEYNRILYLGTAGNYSQRVAFRLNSERHSMRKYVVEQFLKGMRQASDVFAEKTRLNKHDSKVWKRQADAYQGDVIAEPQKHVQVMEKIIRSDVAKGWDTKIRSRQIDGRSDAEFTNVMVTEDVTKDPDVMVIKSILHLHDEVKSKDNCTGYTETKIHDKPINEYSCNPELLHLAFPMLFPLGIEQRHIRTTGTLRTNTVRRLLCSADGRFARSKSFLFLLANQKMRHENNMKVSLRIDANTEMSRKFVAFVNSEEFDSLCVAAAQNPKGKSARVLLAKIRPLVAVSGQTTKWSALERAASKSKLFSMAQVFGPSALFVTFAPKALDCPLVIKHAAMHLGLSEREMETLSMPSRLNERVRMVSDNPVAQARAFQHMVRGFCNIIIGKPQWNERSKRKNRLCNKRGLFGTPLAYFGPNEVQHRGGLHLHTQIQVSEMLPFIVQRFAHNKAVMKKYTHYLNSVVTGSVRGFEHIDANARKKRVALSKQRHDTEIFVHDDQDLQQESKHHTAASTSVARYVIYLISEILMNPNYCVKIYMHVVKKTFFLHDIYKKCNIVCVPLHFFGQCGHWIGTSPGGSEYSQRKGGIGIMLVISDKRYGYVRQTCEARGLALLPC